MRTRPRYLATLSSLLLGVAALLCCVLSCDESFNPSAPFQPRMVVYSVLTTESDTQYVRVYSSYNPPDYDPTKNPDDVSVNDAQVSIAQEGGPTFTFQPFTIRRSDTSRYTDAITAYRAFPFRPEKGKTYTLMVSSPTVGGTVSAITTVPGQGDITPINSFVLGSPLSNDVDFGLTVTISPEAKAFLGRIYIDYLYPLGDGTYQSRRFEIPLSRAVINCSYNLYQETYPRPKRRSTPAIPADPHDNRQYQKSDEHIGYNRLAYLQKISYLYDREGAGIIFKQAVFYLIQFDQAQWKYYGVANIYRDSLSIRTDEPDYTNIQNGAGVFGSTAVDSVVRQLPEVIPHLSPGCN